MYLWCKILRLELGGQLFRVYQLISVFNLMGVGNLREGLLKCESEVSFSFLLGRDDLCSIV